MDPKPSSAEWTAINKPQTPSPSKGKRKQPQTRTSSLSKGKGKQPQTPSKQKTTQDNVDWSPTRSKRPNICAVRYASVPSIPVDGHKFSSPATLERYIDTLEHGDEQFSAEQQALEFYITYAGTISEQESLFADKVKERGSWKTAGCTEEDLDTLAKSLHDHKAQHQTSKDSRKVALETIESKWGKNTASYIRGYNPSEKFAKTVRKAVLLLPWTQARELVTHEVLWQLEMDTRYGTLMRLSNDWQNITRAGVRAPSMAPIEDIQLKRLGISISEPWGDITDGYNAKGLIIGDENEDSNTDDEDNVGTGGADGAGGAGAGDNNTDEENSAANAAGATGAASAAGAAGAAGATSAAGAASAVGAAAGACGVGEAGAGDGQDAGGAGGGNAGANRDDEDAAGPGDTSVGARQPKDDNRLPGYSTPRAPPYSLLSPHGQIMVLSLAPTSVPTIPNVVIDQRGVNTDWNCEGCVGSAWNHAIFCKTVDFSAPNDLFKGFQILEIVYILDWALCFIHHARLKKMLQMVPCPHATLKVRTAMLWKQRNGNLMALQKFVATHPSWFVDYIMMDGTSLDGAWESGGTFVQKAEKGDEQFVGNGFVEEAKEDSQFEEWSRLSEQFGEK